MTTDITRYRARLIEPSGSTSVSHKAALRVSRQVDARQFKFLVAREAGAILTQGTRETPTISTVAYRRYH